MIVLALVIILGPIIVARKKLYYSLVLMPHLCGEEGLGVGLGAEYCCYQEKEREVGQIETTVVH